MEPFKERRARWERAIEGVLVEMNQEKDCNGLALYVNVAGIMNEFNSEITNIETMLLQGERGCGINKLIPGDKLNEE